MTEEHRQPLDRKPRRGRYFLLLCVFLALVLVGAYGLWSVGSGRRLDREVAALRARGEPTDLADFREQVIEDDEQNAAVFLRDAASSIDEKTKAFKKYDPRDFGLPLTDKELAAVRAVIAENHAAFDNVDQAMKRKSVDWQVVLKSPAISVLLPDIGPQRQLARLVSSRALLNAHEGDHAAAIKDVERVLFIAGAVDRQQFLVGHLVADGIRAIACDDLAQMTPELKVGAGPRDASPQQVARIIAALLDVAPQRAALHRAMQGERMLELDTARCLLDGRVNLSNLSGGPRAAGAQGALVATAGAALKPMIQDDTLLMLRHVTAVIAAIVAAPDLPAYRAHEPVFPVDLASANYSHLLARMLLPAFTRAIETDYRVITQRRVTAAALAVRWYAADHGGKLPQKIQDLVPKYLPSVPQDAMAANKPIRYIDDPTKPILYSVGANGIDDGGNTQPMQPHQSDTWNKDPWNQLDFVVHLTRQPRPPAKDSDVDTDDDLADPQQPPQASTQPASAPAIEPPS
jgi:hypothetical protein